MSSTSTFTAAYGGKCPSCGDRFEEGDEIGFIDSESKPVCDNCWVMWS